MRAQQQQQDGTPKIDNIKPKWVTCVWLVFFVLIGFLFLMVLAIPTSVVNYKYGAVFCNPDLPTTNKYVCAPFNLQSNPDNNVYSIIIQDLSPKNQFLIVDMTPKLASFTGKHEEVLNFTISVYALGRNYEVRETIFAPSTHKISIWCNDDVNMVCDNRTLVYLNQVDFHNIMILIEFNEVNVLKDRGVITFDSYVTTINSKYTEFLLALRYVCMCLSLIFLLFYWRSLRKQRGSKIVFEQKFIKWLGIFLVFFNDPIYAITVLKPNLVSAVFSAMFVITFVCALLLFWISAFQRIYSENAQVKTRTLSWQKFVYIFFLWLFSVVAYNILSREYLEDPGFDFNDEYQDEFKAFKILMIIFIAIGLGWMFFGFVQILKKYNSIIWRHKMLFSFSTYFIFCYFVFMFTGTLSVYNINGTKVMLLFGISNVYIWFLMILYTPSSRGFEGAEHPIALSENIREFNNYEPLDESAANVELGSLPKRGPEKVEEQEDHSPDEIIFQLDGNGNIMEKNNAYGANRQQAYAVNDNYAQKPESGGFGGNYQYGGNNQFGGGHQFDNAGQLGGNTGQFGMNQQHGQHGLNQQHGGNNSFGGEQKSSEQKYPFEHSEDTGEEN